MAKRGTELTATDEGASVPIIFAGGTGRAMYRFVRGKRIIVLHAFIKKTQQTPDRDLKLARKRLQEVLHA
jgi:phage-related protein